MKPKRIVKIDRRSLEERLSLPNAPLAATVEFVTHVKQPDVSTVRVPRTRVTQAQQAALPETPVARIPEKVFPPITSVTRTTVTTEEAAYYLNRKPQTLRGWSSAGKGAVTPLNIQGRLAWPVADIRALLEGGAT